MKIIAPQITSAPVIGLYIAAGQAGRGITAVAIGDFNGNLNTLSHFLAVFLLRIVDRIPLSLVVILRCLDLFSGRRGEDGSLGNVFEGGRNVVRITAGVAELFGDGGHVKFKRIVLAEINHQRHAPFATLGAIIVLIALLFGSAVIGCGRSLGWCLRRLWSCRRVRCLWRVRPLRGSGSLRLISGGCMSRRVGG